MRSRAFKLPFWNQAVGRPAAKPQAGQGMTEYIIIVALIAIAAIGVFMFFGNTARQQVAGMATELSGQDSAAQRAAAVAQAAQATVQAGKGSGLGQYGGNNQQ